MADPVSLSPKARLAVLGSPIAHSQSPVLHAAAYDALGLDWEYDRIEVAEGELAGFLAGLGPEWRGLSLTMPLKHEALPLVTDLDRIARLTNAVNTVLVSHGGTGRTLSGFNTDVTGMVRALGECGISRAPHVTVLGAGATARSALAAAADLGAEDVDVLVRTRSRAAHLVDLGRSLGLVVRIAELDSDRGGDTSTLVISTLPGGTEAGSWFPASFRRLNPLFDVAYSPWPSALARAWQESGGTAYSGLGMLLHQALVQVRIFVGGDPFAPLPDEETVLAAMRGALEGETGVSQPVGG